MVSFRIEPVQFREPLKLYIAAERSTAFDLTNKHKQTILSP